MESDSQSEALARGRDLEGDQGGVLAGEEGLVTPAGADRLRSLVQGELVVLRAWEDLPIQLPTVKHLER